MLDAQALVGGHGDVDQPRLWQVEAIHDSYEFVARLAGEPRIVRFLASDARHLLSVVIVGRIDQRAIGQTKQALRDAVVQRAGVAALKISAAATVDE